MSLLEQPVQILSKPKILPLFFQIGEILIKFLSLKIMYKTKLISVGRVFSLKAIDQNLSLYHLIYLKNKNHCQFKYTKNKKSSLNKNLKIIKNKLKRNIFIHNPNNIKSLSAKNMFIINLFIKNIEKKNIKDLFTNSLSIRDLFTNNKCIKDQFINKLSFKDQFITSLSFKNLYINK